MVPNSLLLALPTKLLVGINCLKKMVHDSLYFTTCKRFFAYRTVIHGLFQLNIKARHEI